MHEALTYCGRRDRKCCGDDYGDMTLRELIAPLLWPSRESYRGQPPGRGNENDAVEKPGPMLGLFALPDYRKV